MSATTSPVSTSYIQFAILPEPGDLCSFGLCQLAGAVLPRTGRSVQTSALPHVAGTRTHIKPTWKAETHRVSGVLLTGCACASLRPVSTNSTNSTAASMRTECIFHEGLDATGVTRIPRRRCRRPQPLRGVFCADSGSPGIGLVDVKGTGVAVCLPFVASCKQALIFYREFVTRC